MQVDVWVHPWDISLEMVDNVLNNIVGFLNVDNITVFANYVNGIKVNGVFLFENRAQAMRFVSGQLFFKPDETLYRATRLKPYFIEGATFFDLKYVIMKARSYGLKTMVHVNFLNYAVSNEDYLNVDSNGDIVKYGGHWMSIHNSNVQRYIIALTNNLALLDFVDLIEIGEYWYPISPILKGRMSCFSKFAQTDAKDRGLDLMKAIPVIKRVAEKLNIIKNSEYIEYSILFKPYHFAVLKKFYNMIRKEIDEILVFRCDIVYDILSSIADVVKSCGAKLSLLVPPPSIAPLLGVDYKILSEIADYIRPIAYYGVLFNSLRSLTNELKEAKKHSKSPVIPVIAITSAINLKDLTKLIKKISKMGFQRISIYGYGFLGPEKLKIISEMLK